MRFSEYFPVFSLLSPEDQSMLLKRTVLRSIKKGTVLHRSDEDCLGLLLIQSGQLRAFISSEEGKEITVYRLFERDVCLFSRILYYEKYPIRSYHYRRKGYRSVAHSFGRL